MQGEAKPEKMNIKKAVKKRNYRLLAKKTKYEALKLSCMAFILIALGVIGYAVAVNYDLIKWLEPKVVYINLAEAKGIEPKDNSIERIADYIYLKESSSGKNGYSKCKAIGQVNNIGYGIYGGKWQCFDNHAEEMNVLNEWISDKRAKGMSDNELLCIYNTGIKSNDCEYVKSRNEV